MDQLVSSKEIGERWTVSGSYATPEEMSVDATTGGFNRQTTQPFVFCCFFSLLTHETLAVDLHDRC